MNKEQLPVEEAISTYQLVAENHSLPKGYKQTEVGVIPEDWDVTQLDSLGAGSVPPIKAGPFGSSLTKDTYVPSGYKVYGQEQVIRGDYLYGDYFISPSKFRELESCSVSPGDVLLSLVGTTGKLLVIPEDAPAGVINPRLIRFSFDKKRVCPLFFKNLFEANKIQALLARSAQGGTMGVLNASMLRPMKIPLPSFPEQRAIATVLSDVDALLAKLDQLITKKRDIKQATMQQLLTGQIRLPGFSGEWKIKRLGELFDVLAGGDFKAAYSSVLQDEHHSFPIYSNSITDSGLYGFCSYGIYPSATITVTARGTVGAANYRDHSYTAIGRVLVLLPKQKLDGRFFSEFINNRISFVVESTGVPQLTAPQISKYELQVPNADEQAAIASFLSDMDTEITALETRRDKTRDLKQGMMQELLTGRIRLI